MRFDSAGNAFKMLDAGGCKFDESLEEIGRLAMSTRCVPKPFPGFMSLPIEACVEEVEAMEVVEAVPPGFDLERARPRRMLSEAVPSRVRPGMRQALTRYEGIGRKRNAGSQQGGTHGNVLLQAPRQDQPAHRADDAMFKPTARPLPRPWQTVRWQRLPRRAGPAVWPVAGATRPRRQTSGSQGTRRQPTLALALR